MPSILLIDDTQDALEGLAAALRALLPVEEATVLTWQPAKADKKEPVEMLEEWLADGNHDVRFVVTDYDLTTKGALGLYGSTVVDQCQLRALPVGDYSRGNASRLPKEPNLFEIRVQPVHSYEASAQFIAAAYRGFESIRETVSHLNPMPRSPAAGIAAILGRPNDQSQFALYGTRYPVVNSGLMDRISPTEGANSQEAMRRLFGYVAGHVLINLVLRYPGLLTNREGLAAYCGIGSAALDQVIPLFDDCRYTGPFSGIDEFFWLDEVQKKIENLEPAEVGEQSTIGESNRSTLEKHLKNQLARHDCARCEGQNGGFYCPFTRRAVCLRPDCSVGSNGWIPSGARLCRVEKEYFEEWSPLLGL